MFRAIGRYFRALGYLVTGRIDKARQTLMANPNVMRATYDQVIHDKTNVRDCLYKEFSGLFYYV